MGVPQGFHEGARHFQRDYCVDCSRLNSGVSWRGIGGLDSRTFEQLFNAQMCDMTRAFSRALMRLLAAAFLLLLGSCEDGRARIRDGRHGSTTEGIATANLSAALATTSVRNDVDTAQPQLSASEANLQDRRIQSAPAPTRTHQHLCSCERTIGEAARPPPFQA